MTVGKAAETHGNEPSTHGIRAATNGNEAVTLGMEAVTHGIKALTLGIKAVTHGMEAVTHGMEAVTHVFVSMTVVNGALTLVNEPMTVLHGPENGLSLNAASPSAWCHLVTRMHAFKTGHVHHALGWSFSRERGSSLAAFVLCLHNGVYLNAYPLPFGRVVRQIKLKIVRRQFGVIPMVECG
jgi:hypothetical protein